MLIRRLARRVTRSRGPAFDRRDEDGAILVIFAVSLTLLLVLTALGVDLGNMSQTKEHTATAAQDAALSAVGQLAPLVNNTGSLTLYEADAVSAVNTYITSYNYPSVTVSDLSHCTKDPFPNGVQQYASEDCIGFFPATDPTGIAVDVPHNVQYTFGQAAGLTSQVVSTIAYASIQTPANGYILPFGVAAGGVGGGLSCIKDSNGGSPCAGNPNGPGLFAVLNSPRYSIFPGSANSGGNDAIIEEDLALGIDHALRAYVPPAPVTCDAVPPQAGCTAYNDTAPYNQANAVMGQTGQTITDVGAGLFTGFANGYNFAPRLNHPDGFVAMSTSQASADPSGGPNGPTLANSDTFQTSYPPLNGVHITDFLIPASGSTDPKTNTLYQTCYQGQGPKGDRSPDPLTQAIDVTQGNTNIWTGTATTEDGCLSNYLLNPTSAQPIFTAGIAKSPRFGIVPVVNTVNGSSAPATIVTFLDAFLYQATGTAANGNGNGSQLSTLTAWLFPPTLVTPGPVGGGPGIGSYIGGPYVANLCSYEAGNC